MLLRPQLFGLVSVLIVMCGSGLVRADALPVYQIHETPGSHLQATLTHDIYRYSMHNQLHDLVVLDSQGNKLPHSVTPLADRTDEAVSSVPITFFPVAAGAPRDTWLSDKTNIRIDDAAVTINIDRVANDRGATSSSGKVPVDIDFHLLDIRPVEQAIEHITLNWESATENHYLKLAVSGSRDLQSWHSIAQETLVHLQKDGEVLLRNQVRLGLSARQYQYLRIKFLSGGEAIALTSVDAQIKAPKAYRIEPDTWSLTGHLASSQASVQVSSETSKSTPVAAWEYQRRERTPVTKFTIHLGSLSYGDRVQLFSRSNEANSWQPIYSGIWFNTQVGSDWQQSDAIAIHPNSDIYWRLELNNSVREKVVPEIGFEQRPLALQFIANNAAPYTVAIDSMASHSHLAGAQIFTQLTGGDLDWVQVNLAYLNPEPQAVIQQARSLDWKTAVFWGALLAAVAVLIGFALHLYREMR